MILSSTIKPGGRGTLPCRITLHRTGTVNTTPFATHLEVLQEDGSWSRMLGHYFGPDEQDAALQDYVERCEALTVEPLEV